MALRPLTERARVEFHRLALAWQSRRSGRSRPVSLTRDSEGFVQVHDGVRPIHVPDLASAASFCGGVGMRLHEVAERYTGNTGYIPREGDVCVDIGAGIGEFALWCRDAGARVTALEPDPLAFRALEQNVGREVRCLPYALWKERSDLQLHRIAGRLGGTLIAAEKHLSTANVEAWPLDQIQAIIALPVIDLMKIAGEGVEPEILIGGSRTLRRTRVVFIDLSASARRRNLRERVEAVLDDLKFRALDHGRTDTLFALNTAMVGPFSSLAQVRRG